jgi:hypothetical protein
VSKTLLNFLSPESGFIFRSTHIANVPWILDHGLHCRTSDVIDPNFIEIGNPDLIRKRPQRTVPIPPGGTLSDYVPFYFTPCTPMLLNIKTGRNVPRAYPMSQIAVLVSALPRVKELGLPFVFTDRHAYLVAAQDHFSSELAELASLEWASLRQRDFKKDHDEPEKFERYQAEALIHQHLPVQALVKLVCYGQIEHALLEAEIQKRGLELEVSERPEWYP